MDDHLLQQKMESNHKRKDFKATTDWEKHVLLGNHNKNKTTINWTPHSISKLR